MTNPELVRIVLDARDGVLVTVEVNLSAYRNPGSRVVVSELEVMNLSAGVCVVTGIGTNWRSRKGREGQIFMPVFSELKSGLRFVVSINDYRAVVDHLRYSLDRPSQTDAVPSLLIRVATSHGVTVLQPAVEPTHRQFENDFVFELRGSPAIDEES